MDVPFPLCGGAMIRSMTGFGAAERDTEAGRLRVEIRTVNHDASRMTFRLPSALDMAEIQLREWLRAFFPRGHVHYALRVDPPEDAPASTLRLDEARAGEYVALLRELKERFGLAGEIDVASIARYSDVIVRRDESEAEAPDLGDVRAVTEAAAREAVRMREDEGRRLQADLEERLAAIEAALAVVADRAPARLVEERDRLRAAIRELVGEIGVDEERLAREIAYLAERWDISE